MRGSNSHRVTPPFSLNKTLLSISQDFDFLNYSIAIESAERRYIGIRSWNKAPVESIPGWRVRCWNLDWYNCARVSSYSWEKTRRRPDHLSITMASAAPGSDLISKEASKLEDQEVMVDADDEGDEEDEEDKVSPSYLLWNNCWCNVFVYLAVWGT